MAQFSKRAIGAPSSPIRKLVPFADLAKKRGIHVFHLNIGDPDIPTPPVLLRKLKDFPYSIVRYPKSQGEPEIITSLLLYYKKLGITLSSNNLLVTSGASEAILITFLAVCDFGDEVITFEPFYANYNGIASVAGVNIITIQTNSINGFHSDTSLIQKFITKKTKAFLLCNPNNPTGTVYTSKEIQAIAALCKKNNLFFIVDEAYREFVYDGKKPYTILSSHFDNVILIDSLSKRYSICGARLGCLISTNPEVYSIALKFAQARLASGFVDQYFASAIDKVPKSYFLKVNQEYEKRRDLLYEKLSHVKGITLQKPEGAFYAMVKLSVADTNHFAKWLLTDFSDKNETVMVAPGEGFYKTKGLGLNEIRLAYVINRKDLSRALDLLIMALRKYQNKEINEKH